MVLYCVNHPGFLAYAIIHRLVRHPHDQAHLITLRDYDADAAIKNDFVGNGVFDSHFTYQTIYERILNAAEATATAEYVEKLICEGFDELFASRKLNIENFDKIILISDLHDLLGIYVSMKGLPFIIAEILPNRSVSGRDYEKKIYQLAREYNPHVTVEVMEKHGVLMGSNPLSHNLIHPASEELAISNAKRYSIFDPLSEVDCISGEMSVRILNSFGVADEAVRTEKTYLLLTASRGLIDYCSAKYYDAFADDFYNLYQALCDYFVPESAQVVLKLHPSVHIQETIFDMFPGAQILPSLFPAEFLRFLPSIAGKRFDGLVALRSFSNTEDKVSSVCRDSIAIEPTSYYKNPSIVCVNHFLLSLLEACANDGRDILYLSRGDAQLDIIDEMLRKEFSTRFRGCFSRGDESTYCDHEGYVIIHEAVNYHAICALIKKSQPSTMLIFTYISQGLEEKYPDLFRQMIRVHLYLDTPLNIMGALYDSSIYIYANNKNVLQKICDFKYSKDLHYLGRRLSAQITLGEMPGKVPATSCLVTDLIGIWKYDNADKIIAYGCGNIGQSHIPLYTSKYPIVCATDRDPTKWGEQISGVPIYSPEETLRMFPNALYIIFIKCTSSGAYAALVDDIRTNSFAGVPITLVHYTDILDPIT